MDGGKGWLVPRRQGGLAIGLGWNRQTIQVPGGPLARVTASWKLKPATTGATVALGQVAPRK